MYVPLYTEALTIDICNTRGLFSSEKFRGRSDYEHECHVCVMCKYLSKSSYSFITSLMHFLLFAAIF